MQIAIVLYPGFTGLDALGPYEFLKMIPNAEICFVAHKQGPVHTDRGILTVHATHSYGDVMTPDLVLVPGSEANTGKAMKDKTLIEWLQQTHGSTRYTTSVCSGALVLAAAGLLEGCEATTHWIAQTHLKKYGAISKPEKRIVKSGKIWTAAGVSAGLDLALDLVLEICGTEHAEMVQLLLEYDPRPPLNTGHPSKAKSEIFDKALTEMTKLATNPPHFIPYDNEGTP